MYKRQSNEENKTSINSRKVLKKEKKKLNIETERRQTDLGSNLLNIQVHSTETEFKNP